jgi:hypothetical protein
MALNFKPMILSIVFGILLILMDFGDHSPFSVAVGNLDQIFGPRTWYPVEVIYPAASIAVFLLFGITCRNIGIKEAKSTKRPETIYLILFGMLSFLIYLLLLALDDLDDISKILKLHMILGANYWFAMEAIYPIGSIILFLAFGKVLYEIGIQ